jgi:hypothetical protein
MTDHLTLVGIIAGGRTKSWEAHISDGRFLKADSLPELRQQLQPLVAADEIETHSSLLRFYEHIVRGRVWLLANHSWDNPSFLPRIDERMAVYERLRAKLASGEALTHSDLLFVANAGGGGDCYAAHAEIAIELGRVGVCFDEGHYHGAGPESAHTWARLRDGTIIDVTHSQFGGPPVVIAPPGSELYDHYIPTLLETDEERAARELDPVCDEARAKFRFPPPRGR